MLIQVINNKILVEKLDRLKDRKTTPNAPFGQFLQSSENLATIIAMDNHLCNQFKVGDQVYFCGSMDKIMIEGRELLVLEMKNIVGLNITPE